MYCKRVVFIMKDLLNIIKNKKFKLYCPHCDNLGTYYFENYELKIRYGFLYTGGFFTCPHCKSQFDISENTPVTIK